MLNCETDTEYTLHTPQWHISECKVHKDIGRGYTDTEPAEHQDMNMNATTTTTYLLLLSV